MAECQCLHPTCIINTKLTNDKEKKRRENLTLHFEYFSMIKMKNEKKKEGINIHRRQFIIIII